MDNKNVQLIPQFSLKHAAHLIGVSDITVRRWLKNGTMFGYKIGNREAWYVDLREINRLREVHQLPELSPEESAQIINLY